jgi:hypothetical protein
VPAANPEADHRGRLPVDEVPVDREEQRVGWGFPSLPSHGRGSPRDRDHWSALTWAGVIYQSTIW